MYSLAMLPRASALLVFLTSLARTNASCMHGTSMMRRQLTPHGTVEVSKFGYTDLQGPLNWGGLAAANIGCDIGKNQSPINLGT